MKLAIRFWYYKPVTPSLHFAELDTDQWRKFLGLEKPDRRRDYIMDLLHLNYMQAKIREMWWIPLDDNMELKVHRKKKTPEQPKVVPTKEQIEQFRRQYRAEVLRVSNEPGSEPIEAEELAQILDSLSDNEIIESFRHGSSPESLAHVAIYYN